MILSHSVFKDAGVPRISQKRSMPSSTIVVIDPYPPNLPNSQDLHFPLTEAILVDFWASKTFTMFLDNSS